MAGVGGLQGPSDLHSCIACLQLLNKLHLSSLLPVPFPPARRCLTLCCPAPHPGATGKWDLPLAEPGDREMCLTGSTPPYCQYPPSWLGSGGGLPGPRGAHSLATTAWAGLCRAGRCCGWGLERGHGAGQEQGDAKAGGDPEGSGVRGWASPDPSQHSALPTPLWEVTLWGPLGPRRAPAAGVPCRRGLVKEAGGSSGCGISLRVPAPFAHC